MICLSLHDLAIVGISLAAVWGVGVLFARYIGRAFAEYLERDDFK